jgi:hypothetical protein
MVNRAAERRPAGLRNYKSREIIGFCTSPLVHSDLRGQLNSTTANPKIAKFVLHLGVTSVMGTDLRGEVSFQPDGEISLQTRCRCSDSRSLTQLLIATGGGPGIGSGWRRLLANVHHSYIVGVKPSPTRQMIEQHHGRGLGAEQSPGDMVLCEQLR